MIRSRLNFLLSFLFVFLILSFLAVPVTFSKEDGFEDKFEEYSLKMEDYKKKHDEYILRRAQYLRFKTLKSESDAYDATLAMLQTRDEAVILYLEALRARLNEAVGVKEESREILRVRINEEIGWFEDHRGKLASAGNLSDLVKDSDEAEERYDRTTPLFYEILINIPSGRINDFEERLSGIFSRIKNKLDQIKQEEKDEYKLSQRKLQIIDRWVFESENRMIRAEEKQVEAGEIVLSFSRLQGKQAYGEYNKAVGILGESKLFYKEAASFLSEITREIKIAE